MFSNGLSIFAIIISAVATYYTYQQSELLKKQYEKQQELEKELKSYAIVIGSETDENLSKNIQNGEIIHFSFSNGSNKPVPYKVEVKSEGIGLYLDKGQPDKAYFNYPLNSKRATLIQPNGEPYRGTFSLWSFKVPSPTAKVSIWVNGEETVSYSYKYNQKTKHYDYMSE